MWNAVEQSTNVRTYIFARVPIDYCILDHITRQWEVSFFLCLYTHAVHWLHHRFARFYCSVNLIGQGSFAISLWGKYRFTVGSHNDGWWCVPYWFVSSRGCICQFCLQWRRTIFYCSPSNCNQVRIVLSCLDVLKQMSLRETQTVEKYISLFKRFFVLV